MREGFGAIAAALALVASATASRGEVLYDQEPVNGGVNAWTINSGYAVADSFTLSQASTVTGVDFGVWSIPGDTMSTVDWAITPTPDTFADMGTAAVSTSYLFTNSYGYAVSWDSFSIPGQTLAAGTYWLVLQNAAVPNGDPIFWDENDGLSSAYETAYGQIGSESFQVLGTASDPPAVPEPSTWAMMLVGFAGLGLAGYSRSKRQRRAGLTS